MVVGCGVFWAVCYCVAIDDKGISNIRRAVEHTNVRSYQDSIDVEAAAICDYLPTGY